MDKISCSVVKDLLPLYVDGVLTEESCKLVKNHIDGCPACKVQYEKMKDTSSLVKVKTASKEKAVIKRIRNKINLKRWLGICVTALLVIAIALGAFYGVVHKQSYLAYADTGLYVENDKLCTDKSYYCYYGFDSPEEGTLFIYMTTTFYESHNENKKTIIVDDSSFALDTDNPDVKQVYYISEEYVKSLKSGSYFVSADSEANYIANNQSKLEELKKNSTLVWNSEQ